MIVIRAFLSLFCRRMKSFRDWVFSQLLSKSLVSSRPLSGSDSFYDEGPLNEEYDEQGTALIS